MCDLCRSDDMISCSPPQRTTFAPDTNFNADEGGASQPAEQEAEGLGRLRTARTSDGGGYRQITGHWLYRMTSS